MTECNDTNMRDLLPDLVAGRLAAAELAGVESHAESCVECTDEIALLRVARSVRPQAVAIDVARIVAALPPRTVTAVSDGASEFTGPRLVRDEHRVASRDGRVATTRAARSQSAVWRMAAAVGIAVIGGWSALMYRGGGGADAPAAVAQGGPIGMLPSETLAVLDDASGKPGNETGETGVLTPSELEVPLTNHLSEYSDEDLLLMLDRLEKWDGATSADPLPTVPIVSVTPRGTL
ncbi:MAG: zf-HC2 domain-containing protein [Gemmatimonadota bacterium]